MLCQHNIIAEIDDNVASSLLILIKLVGTVFPTSWIDSYKNKQNYFSKIDIVISATFHSR